MGKNFRGNSPFIFTTLIIIIYFITLNTTFASQSRIVGYYELIAHGEEVVSNLANQSSINNSLLLYYILKIVGEEGIKEYLKNDFNIKLLINTDNNYLLVTFKEGNQNKIGGKYTISKDTIILENFWDGKDAVFSYKKTNNLLTLKLKSVEGESELKSKLIWTFINK